MIIKKLIGIWLAGILSAQVVAAKASPLFAQDDLKLLDRVLDRAATETERRKTSRALVEIFSSKAVANLEEEFSQGKSKGRAPSAPDRKSQNARILSSVGDARLAQVRKIFHADLESKELPAKRSAMWWFLMIDPNPSAKLEVVAQLKSKETDARFEAARQLALLSKDSSGEPILLNELDSQQSSRVLLAAEALSKIKNEKGRLKALEIYSSTMTNAMARGIAVAILSEFESPATDRTVVEAIFDPNQQVVSAALGRLQARSYPLNSRATERLLQITNDRVMPDSAKMMAVWSLSASKDRALSREELSAQFIQHLKSDDYGILATAVTGLMAFGGKQDVKHLIPLLDHPNNALKAHVDKTIGKISGVRSDPGDRDVDSLVTKRKGWWALHSSDSEYR